MTNAQKQQLNKMGTGWFILKYASEHGANINTSLNYGSSKAMKSRHSAYEATETDHMNIIKSLKQSGISNRVSGGFPKLNASQISKILKKI